MSVLFSDVTLTLRKSGVHCCGVMQFWACSSLISVPLPAEAGCETWVRIVLKWPSLRNSNMATRTVARKSSIGGLYVRAGVVDIQIWQNFHQLTVFHISIWVVLGALFGGAKPTKSPPVATGLMATKVHFMLR